MAVRLGIVGTRVLACPGDAEAVVQRVRRHLDWVRPDIVISGGADGVDSIAERVAEVAGYSEDDGTLLIFRPTVRRFHGPGGYRERDKEIAHTSTHLLRLACLKATTYGSGWTADEAERIGRKVVREQVCGMESPSG